RPGTGRTGRRWAAPARPARPPAATPGPHRSRAGGRAPRPAAPAPAQRGAPRAWGQRSGARLHGMTRPGRSAAGRGHRPRSGPTIGALTRELLVLTERQNGMSPAFGRLVPGPALMTAALLLG